MEDRMQKIFAREDGRITLKIVPGHFVTPNAHITHYFDMTTLKARVSEAKTAAQLLAQKYSMSMIVDTIVCMDKTETIGTFFAEELSNAGIMSINTHSTIYVIAPEINTSGQIIFRDNLKMMIENKNVLILMASATTGKTLQSCVESVLYYGGKVGGIAAVFSNVSKVSGVPVHAIFTQQDVPDYQSYSMADCPMCRNRVKIDAMVNGYGYSKL
ncbi:MAG: orotate phosphoribosyltransferase [Lachnospiraceae bacterium]|nr:orotate phosphoribosyltransferase [Lachnospiraceae bacterium]